MLIQVATYISELLRSHNFVKFLEALSLERKKKKRAENFNLQELSIKLTANYRPTDDLYSGDMAWFSYADIYFFFSKEFLRR